MDRLTRALLGLSRWLVALLFLFSGLIKANDLWGFVYKLEEYIHVLSTDLKLPWLEALMPHATAIGAGITLLELAVGILLFLGLFRWLTTVLLALLMILFTLLTGFSAITGAVTDCGCFGDVLKISPWVSFGKDVVLLFLAFFLQVYREDLRPLFKPLARGVVALVFIGLCGLLLRHTYYHLPLIDLLPYAVGQDLRLNTQPQGEELPKAKDYIAAQAACDTTEFAGAVLIIAAQDAARLDSLTLGTVFRLGNSLKGTDIRPILMTAALTEDRDSLARVYKPSFCIAPQDQTVLKTMVRSDPGYLLLQDGIVVGKWHQTDAPSESELRSKLTPR
ncbi:MAG: DoxX family membrane protein [Bacteroidia bacterium]|nr:DoxX family membrane protein [Bacteroidia bacterium]